VDNHTEPRDGDQDVLSPLAREIGDPALRRDVRELLGREIRDPALRRRILDLLERDAATLTADEGELLAATVAGVLDADSQRLKAQMASDQAAEHQPFWPKAWPRPWALRSLGCLMAGFGFLSFAVGLVALAFAVADRQDLREQLVLGLCLGGFGAAMLLGWGLLFRSPGRAPPRLGTVQDGDVVRTGAVLPYSRARVVRGIAACGGVCAIGAGLLLGATVGLGWPGLVLGTPLLLAGTVGVIGPLRRGAGRDWRLVLLPEGVLHLKGQARTFVPWDHVSMVHAYEGPGRLVGTLGLDLLVDDQAAIDTTVGPPSRKSIRHRGPSVDLTAALGRLAVDPSLVYAALRYYTAHPQARAELADDRGAQRLARRELR
jgi:hypothetical protein